MLASPLGRGLSRAYHSCLSLAYLLVPLTYSYRLSLLPHAYQLLITHFIRLISAACFVSLTITEANHVNTVPRLSVSSRDANKPDTVNCCMFDLFHNLNVSLRHTKVSTPVADWGLVFCMAQGHGYQCQNIEHAAVQHGVRPCRRLARTGGFLARGKTRAPRCSAAGCVLERRILKPVFHT